MEVTRRVDRRYLAAHGALMFCLGLATCVLASLMASLTFARAGYAIAIALSATCLLFTLSNFVAMAHRERFDCPISNYLIVGLLSIGSWSILWLSRPAPIEVHLLSLLAGMHGVIWSMWYVRLAFHLIAFPAKAAFLSLLAATTSLLGIVLAIQPQSSRLSAVATAAYFSMFVGLQILMSTIYLYRELETEVELLSYNGPERSGQYTTEGSRTPLVLSIVSQPNLKEDPIRTTVN